VGPFVIFLLIILLFFSSRFAAVGRGLGEGIRNFKRGYRGDSDPAPKPTPKVLSPIVELAPPKLLPAKGESSAPQDEPPAGSRDRTQS
jgi:Sec-independent protein translocase protein TatA